MRAISVGHGHGSQGGAGRGAALRAAFWARRFVSQRETDPVIQLIFPRLPRYPRPADWGALCKSRTRSREILKNR